MAGRSNRRAVCGVAVLAIALTACGGGKEQTSQAPPPANIATSGSAAATPSASARVDACALVTKAEAEELADIGLQEPTETETTCTYTSPPTGHPAQVEVYVGPGAKQFLDTDRRLKHPMRPIDAGDEGYVELEAAAAFFRVGTLWIGINVVGAPSAEREVPLLEEQARRASERI